jgi:hypothetical protein
MISFLVDNFPFDSLLKKTKLQFGGNVQNEKILVASCYAGNI